MTRAPEEPFLVTTAGKSPREEQRERTRRYLLTMGIRVVCFVLAIVLVAIGVPWEFSAIAIAASLILPWVAVVAANAGPKREHAEQPTLYLREPPKRIGRRGSD
jgi:archaellum biogenesis protein FlaJ (TadC family)